MFESSPASRHTVQPPSILTEARYGFEEPVSLHVQLPTKGSNLVAGLSAEDAMPASENAAKAMQALANAHIFVESCIYGTVRKRATIPAWR